MKPFQEQTYYELLEIPVAASDEEIRSAYARQSELYAADSVAIYALEDPSQAEVLRSKLHEAMEILTDSDLREEYDRSIGLAPPLPRADRLREDEEGEEDQPTQLAMAEVIADAEARHSTHPELAVSYVSRARPNEPAEPARAEEDKRDEPRPPEPRTPEPARLAEPEASPVPGARQPRSPGGSEIAPVHSRSLESAPQLAQESAIASAEAALAQVAAKVKEVRQPPPQAKPLDISADAEFNGELLRRVREARGVSLAQVADRTRISSRHLENIEADRYKDLPVQVYLRGILMTLAREYGLDALRVSKSYLGLTGVKK